MTINIIKFVLIYLLFLIIDITSILLFIILIPYEAIFLKKIFFKISSLLEIRKSIILFNYFPSQENLKDGYHQRVYDIHHSLAGLNKIYIHFPARLPGNIYRVARIDEDSIQLTFNRLFFINYILAYILCLIAGRVYCHSIFCLNTRKNQFLYRACRFRVLDLHGVVPEEHRYEDDLLNYYHYSTVEKKAVKHASCIVCVTRKMEVHLRSKYNLDDTSFITLPIINTLGAKERRDKDYNRIKVVYCGGTQKWQQLDKMIDLVSSFNRSIDFIFLVPKPEIVEAEYGKSNHSKFPAILTSAVSDEVGAWYAQCHYGLVLRDNSIVNSVACPTKLIEYIQNDIVPIVDNPDIGDFKGLGYRYLRYSELNAVPDHETWKQMVHENRLILEQITSLSISMKEQLHTIFTQ